MEYSWLCTMGHSLKCCLRLDFWMPAPHQNEDKKRKRKISDSVLWQKVITPTETAKKQIDNTKRHKNFYYTAIADRLKTVSLRGDSHPAGMVKQVYGIPTFPITAKAVLLNFKDTYLKFNLNPL